MKKLWRSVPRRLWLTLPASVTFLGVSLWQGSQYGEGGAVAAGIGSLIFGVTLIGKPAGDPTARTR
jgi:hypothetical protein